jgi:MT0933-like antitoxin protein
MGLGDKFKELAKQAQDTVVEHRDQIHDAVETVSVAADRKTKGKYTNQITKFGKKAGDALDKLDDEHRPPEKPEPPKPPGPAE